ncbi:uncharacterized protein DS421_20g679410 [Arachis hypogaea]|nr:uncharacterized protein DS421_20g679410 [Arachis hypogaea]
MKDLKCATRLLSEKFEKMSEAKKVIVLELGFGGLMHIPSMNVPHKLLKELANSFNLHKNKFDTRHGDLFSDKVNFKDHSEENKEIFRRVQLGQPCLGLAMGRVGLGLDYTLTLPADKKAEAILGPPWVSHWNRELLVARIRAEIDGHMVIVKRAEVKKKLKEMKEKEKKDKKEKTKKKKVSSSESDSSESELAFSSESEFEQDSEEATKRRKQPTRTTKKMVSRKRKQILEDSTSESESESNDETQSKKRKHIVEDSSSEEKIKSYDVTEEIEEFFRESKKKKTNEKAAQGMKEARLPSTEGHYDSSKIMPEVNLGSENDHLFQTQMGLSNLNKPTDSM